MTYKELLEQLQSLPYDALNSEILVHFEDDDPDDNFTAFTDLIDIRTSDDNWFRLKGTFDGLLMTEIDLKERGIETQDCDLIFTKGQVYIHVEDASYEDKRAAWLEFDQWNLNDE